MFIEAPSMFPTVVTYALTAFQASFGAFYPFVSEKVYRFQGFKRNIHMVACKRIQA